MIPSITDVRRSLSDCRASLDRLADIRPAEGVPAERTTKFAEFAVTWQGGRWLLCTPLAEEAVEHMSRLAARMRCTGSKYLAEFRVFHSELRFADSAGGEHLCDVVMQRLPEGIVLARASGVSSHERMLAELDAMQAEFRRMGFTHNNLKPENIIVTPDDGLVAVRCHFASFGGSTDGDDEAFGSLRRFVLSKPEVDESSDTVCGVRPVVAAEFEVVGPEQEQRIRICRDGLTGYADTAGNVVVEPQFDEAEDFREGRAEVSVNGRMGLIDKSGRFVIPAGYEYLEYRDDCGISLVRSGGVWSAFDYEGCPTGIHHEDVVELCRMIEDRLKITIEI